MRNTPVLLGENDVIKTIQAQPGVVEGTEGLAGMYVHGGNADENLFMLDNVPLYQVNHFAGFFSAFNPEIIRYIDFFKTSVPAKYDGRLSSFMDVRLMNGNTDGHHGTAKLGLTSGALNISGPIGKRTTYLVGLRRSWYDVLTIPLLALVNAKNEDESIRFHYYFMDFNAKLSHRFSSKANAFISFYYGDDMLRTGYDSYNFYNNDIHDLDKERYNFNWGNMVGARRLELQNQAESRIGIHSCIYTLFFEYGTDLPFRKRQIGRQSGTSVFKQDKKQYQRLDIPWRFRLAGRR